MVVGYRNSAGVDFDDLFQPGELQAPGFRKSDGGDLRYAPRGTTTKVPNVGYRDSLGSDLSNLWMPRGAVPPVPGFDGQTYRMSSTAPLGATGSTQAEVQLTMWSDGTWTVRGIRVNAVDAGNFVLGSGTWLPAGSVASDFTVQFGSTSGTGQGTLINGAAAPSNLATSRTISIAVQVTAASSQIRSDERNLTVTLTRIGSGASVAHCLIGASAAGFV